MLHDWFVGVSLQHFREDSVLSEKLEELIQHANNHAQLTPNEKNAAMEVDNMYQMQREATEDQCPVMQLKLSKEPVHLVSCTHSHCTGITHMCNLVGHVIIT